MSRDFKTRPTVNAAPVALLGEHYAGAISIPYNFSDSVIGGNPGDGYLATDNADLGDATEIFLALEGSDGADYNAVLAIFADSTSDPKGYFRIHKRTDPTDYVVYSIIANTFSGAYYSFSVLAIGLTLSNFTDEDDLVLHWTPTGDKGDVADEVIDEVNYNGIVADYPPPSGIDNITGLSFDPTAVEWTAARDDIACPQGDTTIVNPLVGSVNDVLWSSYGVPNTAGFGTVVKEVGGDKHFCANLKGKGTTGSVEPTAAGVDGNVYWTDPVTRDATGWQSLHNFATDTHISENGYIWRAINIGGTTAVGEPDWAGVAEGPQTIFDGSIIWARVGYDAGAWTSTTDVEVEISSSHQYMYVPYVTIASDATKFLVWEGATGTFGTTGGSEPAWGSASSTARYWLDNEVVWVYGSDLYGGAPEGGRERVILTGLQPPTGDSKTVRISNSGTDLMSVVLADASRITDETPLVPVTPNPTDVDSTYPFDFNGRDIELQAGQSTVLVWDDDDSLWRGGGQTPLGTPAGGMTFFYYFDNVQTDSDPPDGHFRVRPGNSTVLLDDLDAFGNNVASVVLLLDDSTSTIKGYLSIYDAYDPSKFAIFSTSGSVTDASGYSKVTTSLVAQSSGGNWNVGGLCVVTFCRTGDAGSTGAAGSAGVDGGSSFAYTFSTTTTDADPGSGLFRFNNATYSSVTQIYIDLLDAAGATVTAWLDSFNDVAGELLGHLKITSKSDHTKWVLFKINTWTTASGYRKLGVSYVSSNGSLTTTTGDTVISFTPGGDDGSVQGGNGWSWYWDSTDTTVTGVGDGDFRTNHASWDSVTQIGLFGSNVQGFDPVNAFDDMFGTGTDKPVRGWLSLRGEGAGEWALYKITDYNLSSGRSVFDVVFCDIQSAPGSAFEEVWFHFTPITDGTTAGTHYYAPGSTDVAVADGGTGASTASAARDNLGLGTANSPEFTGINVGHASDTTVTKLSSGDIQVEGNRIFRVGGADVPIADGGTGASTAGAAATALGVGTGDSPQFAAVNIGDAADTTVTRVSPGVIAVEGVTLGLYPPGHIYDLIMSNAADANNDITIAAGSALSDDGTTNMVLAAPITKQLDAAWAVGTNAGGINTGAEANSTWYEVHLIKRVDTGVVDVMFTTTGNRATLPASYTKKRRIGWIRNNASGNILAFQQVGERFTLSIAINDLAQAASATGAVATLTVPPNAVARFRASAQFTASTNAQGACLFAETYEDRTAQPDPTTGLGSLGVSDIVGSSMGHFEIRVDSSSQIWRDESNATAVTMDISTYGWIDQRGRLQDI